MLITRELLERKKACGDQVDIFAKEWPEDCEVTKANLLRAAKRHLDLDWFARHFLPPTLRAEYRRQVAPLVAQYIRQEAPIWAKYRRQMASLEAEYMRQEAPLWAESERQEALLWAEFGTQVAPLRAEYERQRALLVWELWRRGEKG